MKKHIRIILSVLLLGAFLLSACAGAAPRSDDSSDAPSANTNEVVDDNGNDANTNDDSLNSNDNADDSNENVNVNGNDNDDDSANSNSDDSAGDGQEIFGVVEVVTDSSVTINGITYNLADFTEIKDVIAVGDQVKIHIIVNADGTLTIREIEKSDGSGDDNGNSNGNSNDDNSNDDDNSNGNSNDDDNNDNGDDDNSNDDDGNDNGDDDNSNGDDNDDDKDDD